jgi:gas vesicle protein
MRHKEFWIALGIGAAVGGVAALLYAPQSGTVTRKKLRRGLEDLAEKLGKEAQKLIDASKEQFDDAFDTASGAVKSATRTAKAVTKLV